MLYTLPSYKAGGKGLDAGPRLLAEDSQPKCASEQTMYI